MKRRFDLFGGNASGFNSREPEVLVAGGAGSGKTAMWLTKILTLADKYPGSRSLIVRKTRESLTESVLVTWENKVLGFDHPVLLKNPTLRRVRQSYSFANGSVVVVGGMDKPDKVLSSEWDFCYVPEATDLTLVDWETLGGRLRAGRVPFQQLAGCCNPTTPEHFLFKRQEAGTLKMYTSKLADNPYFFDRTGNDWTNEGSQYLARLNLMTGARKRRFLEGEWSVAEGLVFEYAPSLHKLPDNWRPPIEWPTAWSIDWGKRSPSVLQIWSVDPEGRMYLFREVFKTRQRPDLLAEWACNEVSSGRERMPHSIVCDHDEESKKLFETAAPHLHLSNADKADRDKGIEEAQSRFDVQIDDGRPRVFFSPTARDHKADQLLIDEGRPTSTIGELSGYVYDPKFLKDEPIAENDHGMDAFRYACRFIDKHFPSPQNRTAGQAYSKAPPTPAGRERISGLPNAVFGGKPPR